MERVAELVRLGRLLALPSPPGPIDPVAAERVALQPREQVVEHLLADLPAAARGQRQSVAVGLSGSRPPGGVAPGRRARRGPVPRRRRAARAPRRGRSRPGRRRLDVRTARPRAGPSPGAGRSGPARHRVPAARRPGTARRSPSPPGSSRSRFDASWARSISSRSSRSSASIIDWSSARCSGVIERSSDCMAAIRSRQLLDDVVEGPGAREELAVPGEERRGVRIAAGDPLAGSAR